MYKCFAGSLIALSLLGCVHQEFYVSARSDPELNALPQKELDQVRVGWFAHSGDMGVTTTTRISPSDWVKPESMKVILSDDAILVCYSISPRPGRVAGAPPQAIRLTFHVPGIDRADKRKVLVSSSCGRRVR